MRNSIKILAASAAAMTISGFGANAALALDEETGCSDIASFAVCLLTENSADTVSTIASADGEGTYAFLGQLRSAGWSFTGLFVDLGDAAASAGQGTGGGHVVTGAEAVLFDSDGDATYAVAVIDDDNGGNDSRIIIGAGQSDDAGTRTTGLVSTEDDCNISLGGEHLAACPVELGVLDTPAVPFVNLP